MGWERAMRLKPRRCTCFPAETVLRKLRNQFAVQHAVELLDGRGLPVGGDRNDQEIRVKRIELLGVE
jgi:hypothetical protein